MNLRLAAGALAGAVLLALSVAACGPREPLRLGFLGGLTGRVSDLGLSGWNGARVAVDEVNASGGIDGRRVELLVRDDGQQADQARQAVADLIESGVALIVGPMTSSMAEVILPLTEAAGIAVISPTVASSRLTGLDDGFFRVISSTKEYAAASARYAAGERGLRRAAVILDLGNEAFTVDWVEHFSVAFAEFGGVVLHTERYHAGRDTSLQEQVERLLATGPDVLLIAASAVDVARISHLARRIDDRVVLLGTSWAATEQLVAVGGRDVEGLLLPQFFDRDDESARYLAFRDAYLERFGQPPGFASVAGYDAAMVALQVLGQETDAASIRHRLVDRSFDGLQQRFPIDAWGDSARDVNMTSIRDGRFRLEAKLVARTR